MVKVKVFVFTKNEYDIIEDFIKFYGGLFGYENVVIIDNKSTDPRVHEVYRKYQALGLCNLYAEERNMQKHSVIMTQFINHFKNECDFAIPLDTDEFIFFPDGGEITKERVNEYFESIPAHVSSIRFKNFYASAPDPESPSYQGFKHVRPAENIINFYDQNWDKIIIRASKFISSSMGNHKATMTDGEHITSDTLGLLHFHETGIYRQYERAKQGVIGYGFIDPLQHSSMEQIQRCHAFMPSTGGHHCRYYLAFLVRSYFIYCWGQMIGNNTLPSAKDMEWLHEHRERKDLGKLVEAYLLEKKKENPEVDNTMTEDILVFGVWPRIPFQYTITQVRDFLRYMDSLSSDVQNSSDL